MNKIGKPWILSEPNKTFLSKYIFYFKLNWNLNAKKKYMFKRWGDWKWGCCDKDKLKIVFKLVLK